MTTLPPPPSSTPSPSSLPPAPKPPHTGADAPGRRSRRWVWPVALIVALFVGVALGSGGRSSDPTLSEEYLELVDERDALRAELSAARDRADAAEADAEEQIAALDEREQTLDDRQAELEGREADVVAREAAVTATEDAIAASQIQIGTWTVGVDIQPGTYRTAEPVTSACYWGIYRSGTNKADIIDNDIVEGGVPTVTLSEGQDFENGCGVWNKQ